MKCRELRHSRETRASTREDSRTLLPAGRRAMIAVVTVLASCSGGRSSQELTTRDSMAIAATIAQRVKSAYDLKAPDVEQRMLGLYAPSGRIVSAAGGRVVTSRDTIEGGVRYFWRQVGSNMRNPQWIWDTMVVDVLSPTSAVMTAAYHIPHLTPRGEPHVLGGAWTAVFEKRGTQWVIVQEHLSDLPQQLQMSDSTRASSDSMAGMKMK
jgi:hypothetical protein